MKNSEIVVKSGEPLDISPGSNALTDAYTDGWLSERFRVIDHDSILIEIEPVFDDAASIEIRPLVSMDEVEDAESNDAQIGSPSGGLRTLISDAWQITEASFETRNGKLCLTYMVPAGANVRFEARQTGGAGDPTLNMRVMGGRGL